MNGLRTLTTIEALELAIVTLQAIQRGVPRAPEKLDLEGLVRRLKDARDEHYREKVKEERARAQLRELSARARSGFRG